MLGIIFDCDGVLVDSEYAHFLCWQKALQKRRISWEKENHYPFSGYPGALIAPKLCQLFNIPNPEALLEDKRSFFLELQEKYLPPMPFAIKLLRQLYEKKNVLNIKLALASGARKKEILSKLQQHDLMHIFDAVVSGYEDLTDYSDPEGTNKPKPYIYLHTAQLLGLSPLHCVAIEDSGPGVLAATRAGIITFAIPNEFTQNHDFSSATYCLTSNTEIEWEAFHQKIKAAMKTRNREIKGNTL